MFLIWTIILKILFVSAKNDWRATDGVKEAPNLGLVGATKNQLNTGRLY